MELKPFDGKLDEPGPALKRFSGELDAPETQAPKLTRTGFVDSAVRGFKRSLPETKSLLAGAGAAVAGVVGADGLRDKALDYYKDVQKEEVEPLANQASFMGVMKGEDNLSEWAGDTLGNFGGQALQSLAAAGAGAVVGSAAPGAGTVGGAAAGLVARPLLKRVIGKEVAEMVAEGAAKDAIGKAALKRAGMIAAPLALNVGQETGIAYTGRAEDAATAGEDLTQTDAMRAIAAGVPAGLLDTVAEGYTANRLLRGASESPSLVRRVAAGAATGALTEAGTEGAQAVLERAGAARELTGEEAYLDYVENAAAGALGGGVAGGGSGVRRAEPLLTRGRATDPLALPAPDGTPDFGTAPITVAPDGTASTMQQSVQAASEREAMGLTPDVNAARAAHPGAAPNVPFAGAAPGSLADSVNATAEAAAPASASVADDAAELEAFNESLQTGEPVAAVLQRNQAPAPGSLADAVSVVVPNADQKVAQGQPEEGESQALNPVAGTIKDQPAITTETPNGSEKAARLEQDPGVQSLDERGGPLPQSEQSSAPQLRGQGDNAAPAVGAELPGVPAGSGAATQPEPHAGTDGQREGLSAGERSLGDAKGAGQQPAQDAPADVPGANQVADSVGGATGAGAIDAAVPSQSGRNVGGASADNPASERTPSDGASPVAAAAMEAATSPENSLKPPSEAQKEAGNFTVGRMKVNGLDISIEHPAGVKRKAEHSQPLAQAYGYIRRTEGADGEKFDVFLGDRADDTSLPVFVVDQKKADGSFDESKGMLGFDTEAAARDAYLSNYPKGWEKTGLGGIRQMTQDEFKSWVKDAKATQKPAATEESSVVAARLARVIHKSQGVAYLREKLKITKAEAAALFDSIDRKGLKEGMRLGADVAAAVAPKAAQPEPSAATDSDELDSATEDRAPREYGPAIDDEIRPLGKKRDAGFKRAESVNPEIVARGFDPADYQIEQTPEGGYIAKRKATGKASPKASEQVSPPAAEVAQAPPRDTNSSKPTAGEKAAPVQPTNEQAMAEKAVQAKARAPAVKTDAARKPLDLLAVIARSGGLNREEFQKEGVDPAAFKSQFGIHWLFRKRGGMGMDRLQEFMQQEHYLPRDPEDGKPIVGHDDVLDKLFSALAGNEVFADDQAQQVAEWRALKKQQNDEYQAELEGDDDFQVLTDEQFEAMQQLEIASLEEQATALGATDADIVEIYFNAENSERTRSGLFNLVQRLEKDASRAESRTAQSSPAQETDDGGRRVHPEGQPAPGNGVEGGRPASAEADATTGAPGSVGEAGSGGASQGGLFAAGTAREEVAAAARAKDAKRDGAAGTGRTDMAAGDGELFAGPRPEQAEIPPGDGLTAPTPEMLNNPEWLHNGWATRNARLGEEFAAAQKALAAVEKPLREARYADAARLPPGYKTTPYPEPGMPEGVALQDEDGNDIAYPLTPSEAADRAWRESGRGDRYADTDAREKKAAAQLESLRANVKAAQAAWDANGPSPMEPTWAAEREANAAAEAKASETAAKAARTRAEKKAAKRGTTPVDSTTVREDAATYGPTRPLPAGPERAGVESPVEASAGSRSGSVSLYAGPSTSVAKPAETLKPRVGLVETGRFTTGIKQVKTWQDAAHIMAPLRKSPQEQMTALVLNDAGHPLAVIRHSIGEVAAASVEMWSLTGAVAAVPGAKRVYFAHNHPSGRVGQSTADMIVTDRLVDLLSGSGIEPMGMIVVAPGSLEASFFKPNVGGIGDLTAPIAAAARTSSVPIMERRIKRVEKATLNVSNPAAGAQMYRDMVPKHGPGVVLLSAHNDVLGLLPMTDAEMGRLRTGDTTTGTAALMRAVHEANAAKVVVFAESNEGGANVGRALQFAGVKLLDVFIPPKPGMKEPQSLAASGNLPGQIDGNSFRSMETLADTDLTPAERASFNRQREYGFKGNDGVGMTDAEKSAIQVLDREESRANGIEDADKLGLRAAVNAAIGGQFGLPPITSVYLRGPAGLDGIVKEGYIARLKDQQKRRTGNKTAGLYLSEKDTIDGRPRFVIFTDVIRTPDMAAFTAAHEVAGHYGLRALLGRGLNPVLEQAGRNPTVKAIADSMTAQRKLRPDQRLLAIEEALADLAAANATGNWRRITDKHGVTTSKEMQSRLRAFIANIVRQIKLLFKARSVSFTDAQVQQLLSSAWKAAQRPSMSVVGANGVLEQVVFHGTPHTVDKFSLNKIGTGEGAQAYGWGAYFASNKEVAEFYRKGLSERDFINHARDAYDETDSPDDAVQALREIEGLSQPQRDLIDALEADGWLGFDYPHQAISEALRRPKNWDLSPETQEALKRIGNLYRVDVPEDTDMLDWDKPLSEQPEKVREALAPWADVIGKNNPVGAAIYHKIAIAEETRLWDDANPPASQQQLASEALNAAGIPGLRYLDGASRAKGDGSANYVIWNEAAIGAPASALESTEDQTQSEAFKKWFGDSAAVDADGKPITLYHGTARRFSKISMRKGAQGLFWMTSDREAIERGEVGAAGKGVIMPLYAKITKPAGWAEYDRYGIGELKRDGYDGLILRDSDGTMTVAAFEGDQIKSADRNNGNFDPDNLSILESVEPEGDGDGTRGIFGKAVGYADKFASKAPQSIPERFDEAQREAARKFATFKPKETLSERWLSLKSNAADRIAQKVIDQFRPLKALNMTAFMQAHMSKGTDGALEAVFNYGIPVLDGGAFNIKERTGGFRKALSELNGEHDEFLQWVVGNRAERLSDEGRERLFTDDDIAAMKRLNLGKMPDGRSRPAVYAQAAQELNRYNRAFLDIAQAAGEIDAEGRKVWEDGFYVPFYRAMEGDQAVSVGQVKGLVKQKIIERLVGSNETMGDPLENILANWSHMLTASMRNMAANAALDSAVELKAAEKLEASEKGAIWTMRDGKEAYWRVKDPAVLEALNSLTFTGYDNPLMRAAGKFKRLLTMGVTISPTFRIRNLMRDALSAAATADVDYNPIRNIMNGLKATAKDSDTSIALMAGGGAIRFGTINDGDQASHAKRMVAMGIDDNQIIDTQDKLKNAMRRAFDKWQEWGDRAETVNRAVIYERLRARGEDHLTASYNARDLMNFTSMGSSAAIRAFAQVLPFFNARLQGVDRLIRGAKQDQGRFMAVAGTVAMASALLFLVNGDDDDYKNLPDYVRDNFWTIKLAGTWLYIPKPFEIGAMASIVERGTELALSDGDYQARDFAHTLTSILTSQLAMNPVPQIARPVMEAAFNFDLFRMGPIDSMGQQNLAAEDRYTSTTTAGAIAAGKVTGMSPQKLEHMVRGYFGWLGVQALNASDYMLRDAMDLPSNPRRDLSRPNNVFVVGDFFKEAGTTSGKYVTRFYAQQAEIDELYASAKFAMTTGDSERAMELLTSPELQMRSIYKAGDKQISRINKQIKLTGNDRTLTAAEKADRIEDLTRLRNSLARRVDEAARAGAGSNPLALRSREEETEASDE